MACFEFIVSFKEAIISIINNYYNYHINVKKDIINVNIEDTLIRPNINIAVVCDLNYGVPLYASDGSIYTIDGKAVYVRTAKLLEYE
jgi:hypothetical protein